MAVTLKHIAEQAGVSVTTVSRILSGRETGVPIRAETRQKVLLIASQLGYKPNLLARGLRGSRSSLLGVIVRDISEPFHNQILRGINDAANKRAYRMFLGHVQRRPDVTIDYASMFEQSHADGIIILGDMEGDEAATAFLTSHHRYVLGISDRVSRRMFPGVYANSALGTMLAMDHLWNLGHRRVTCVSDLAIRDGQVRAETYQRYMREHGAERYISVYVASRSAQAGYEAGQDILTTPDRPTAIFAATDTIAVGLMQAAFQAGIAIPDQLSIIGYDDIDFAPFTIPPLTTVRQSGFEMGRIAASLLLDMIERERNGSDVDDVILEPTLIIRQSAGRCTS